MRDSQDIGYVTYISNKDYNRDRKQMVPPAELTDEFYTVRYILPNRMRSPMHYAIDELVSIEHVEERADYFLVRHQYAQTSGFEPGNRDLYEHTSTVEPDGIVFAKFAQKSLFRRLREKRSELGYFLSVQEEWEKLLRGESQRQPKSI